MKTIFIICFIFTPLFFTVSNVTDVKPCFNPKSEYKIKGIDLSHHNNINDWSSISNQVKFCIIKSTEGSKFVDPKFNSIWDSAKNNGLTCGAYHFFKNGVKGKKQFENFKKTVKLSKGDLPPVLDVETEGCDMREVNVFLKLAEKHYGVKPIIYSSRRFFKRFIENDLDGKYPLWIYINESKNVKPSFDDFECPLWQYSHTGSIDGIRGDVDLNYFMGDSLKFESLKIK